MPMQSQVLPGCCDSTYFYNMGGAHGHKTATSQKEFDSWFRNKNYNNVCVSITSSSQSKTNEYLKNQGWKTEKVAHLYVHTIKGDDLCKYLIEVKYEEIEKPAPGPKFAKPIGNKDIIRGQDVLDIIRTNGALIHNMYSGFGVYTFNTKQNMQRNIYNTDNIHILRERIYRKVAARRKIVNEAMTNG
jgi:hypothetical protein